MVFATMIMSNKFSTSGGFTLIELLVVIAIIGVLSSAVLASLNSARLKANDARRISDLHQIQTALELYYDSSNSYPSGSFDSRVGGEWTTFSGYLSPAYMPTVPVDPRNGSGEGAMCGNCGEYYYSSTDGQKYVISTYLAIDGSLTTNSNQYGPYHSVTSGCTPSTFWACD